MSITSAAAGNDARGGKQQQVPIQQQQHQQGEGGEIAGTGAGGVEVDRGIIPLDTGVEVVGQGQKKGGDVVDPS